MINTKESLNDLANGPDVNKNTKDALHVGSSAPSKPLHLTKQTGKTRGSNLMPKQAIRGTTCYSTFLRRLKAWVRKNPQSQGSAKK